MTVSWHFNKFRPGDRTRETKIDNFFSADGDRASPIIREGIQNSLDAADDGMIRVRLTLGIWRNGDLARWNRYSERLSDHLNAIREKLPGVPNSGDDLRYLVFEDFQTSGLCGDPGQWHLFEGVSNPFFNYFRAEGVSNKEEGNRGRHGVGKFVFANASKIRTIFGLTRRSDGRELLMATAILKHHFVDGVQYMPDGWFGTQDAANEGNVLPIELDHEFIGRFKSDFNISRSTENGLSVVVPWLEEDINREGIIRAVVEGYYFPIIRRLLVVEVVDMTGDNTAINADTLKQVASRQGDEFYKRIEPILELAEATKSVENVIEIPAPDGDGAPYWKPEAVNVDILHAVRRKLDQSELVAIKCWTRIRNKEEARSTTCHFSIFMKRGPSEASDVQFIREGIIISDVRTRRVPGIRAIVVVDEGPLATFLGDAENPAHTQWQKELVKNKYRHHSASIDYVVNAIPSIIRFIGEEQSKPDPLPLKDLFFLPDDSPNRYPPTQKRPSGDAEAGTGENHKPPPKARPKHYTLSQIDGGFIIRRGSEGISVPQFIEVWAAYDTRRGNPLAAYSPSDFRIGHAGIEVEPRGVIMAECDLNCLKAEIRNDDFEIRVTGFDKNRDLHIVTKVRLPEVSTETEEEGSEVNDA